MTVLRNEVYVCDCNNSSVRLHIEIAVYPFLKRNMKI